MKFKMMALASAIGLMSSLFVSGLARAADEAAASEASPAVKDTPLKYGPYVKAMGYFVHSDDKASDIGGQAELGAGYRKDFYAVEVSGIYGKMKNTSMQQGITIGGLLFPITDSGLFISLGLGVLNYNDHPNVDPGVFHTLTTAAGAGYLLPLHIGRYEFAVRAEAKYRYGKRDKHLDITDVDYAVPRYFNDELIGIGLQLPLSSPPPPPPPPPPPAVVKVAPACSDGMDNDGDGKIDYPNDPGCTSADDNDETDPPQCSDGIDNDHDGQIDFPADKGCTSADDNDETDPCKAPLPGEKVSLAGCSTGDILVLRGVNFEFDKSKLTPNAKAILDNVADELKKYAGIKVEIGGHTDSKGSDEYNQRLSEARARSVRKYLMSIGIAEERMTTVGYGETQPVADNDTDEGREQNRRVELKIVGNDSGGLSEPIAAPSTGVVAAPTSAGAVGPAEMAAPAGSESTPPLEATMPAQ